MLNRLELIIKYEFDNVSHLHRALLRKDNISTKLGKRTRLHFENPDVLMQIGDQTALETLGDAVVDVYILENTIKKGATSRQHMHNRKRDYGKNLTLIKIAKKIQLQDFVYWSENEENSKIWEKEGSKVLADCFEALMGAIYLDNNMESVRKTLDTLGFLKIYENTPTLTELEEKIHTCETCHKTDLREIIFHRPVYSFGDPSGKDILVVGINPSTREYEESYLSDSEDPLKRHLSQRTYFKRNYYNFFTKIEAFFNGQVQDKIGWMKTPWEKIGFIDLVKCPSRRGKKQWSGLTSKQKRMLIQNCQGHIINQLDQLNPRIIVPYGADVCKWFAKRYNTPFKPFHKLTVTSDGKENKILFLYQKQGPYSKELINKVRKELAGMI